MYGLLTKLLISGKLKFEEGRILFSKQPMTFLPLATLKKMTDDAIEGGKKEIQKLYLYGWHFGFLTTKEYMRTFKLKKFEETYRLIMDVASMMGYGDYKTFDFKRKRYSRFENIKNPFGLLYKLHEAEKPVCHYIRGANAGGGAALHEILMNGIELKCTAVNRKYCVFMNVANDLLPKKYPKLTKEQLDLKWLLPRQIKIIKECGEKTKEYLKKPPKEPKIEE